MSKTRLVACPLCSTPASSRRVRKVLPVPLFPKIPLLRFTSSPMSTHSLVSMSRGEPIQKRLLLSVPKTSSTSAADAGTTAEKWEGTVFAGCGPWLPSPAPIDSRGSTRTVP